MNLHGFIVTHLVLYIYKVVGEPFTLTQNARLEPYTRITLV